MYEVDIAAYCVLASVSKIGAMGPELNWPIIVIDVNDKYICIYSVLHL